MTSKVKHQFLGHILVAFFKSFHLICDMIIKFCEISQIFAMRNFAFSPKFRQKCENFAFRKFRENAKDAKFRKISHHFRFRRNGFLAFRKNPSLNLSEERDYPLLAVP